eukprot:11161065-Lingulodinium_polyedra.AAC.1
MDAADGLNQETSPPASYVSMVLRGATTINVVHKGLGRQEFRVGCGVLDLQLWVHAQLPVKPL